MKNYLILSVILILFTIACKKDDNEVLLEPNAGKDQVTVPFELVTLDGTATKGPEGYSIEWIYEGSVPEAEINFQNENTLSPDFTPPVNGTYFFTLKISSGGNSASDQVKIETSGAIVLGGTIDENLELKNVEPDPSKSDYIITSDLIVPSDKLMSVMEDGIVIEVMENTGIVIQEGGMLSNYNVSYDEGYNTVFKSSTSWKGILIDGGTITLQDARIENAGDSNFENHTEAAALVLAANSTIAKDFSNNVFVNSSAIDFLVEGAVTINGYFTDNTLSYTVPIKVPFNFITYIDGDNTYPVDYDYIFLKVNEAVIENHPEYEIFKLYGEKYYLDGTLHLAESIYITLGTHVLMKEGAGIVIFDGSLVVQDWIGEGQVIFEGISSANWIGLASTDEGSFNLKSSLINNAGYGLFNTGLFQSEQPASIYQDNNKIFRFMNCELKNSGGYGIYYTGETGDYIYTLENNTFENTALPAIRTTVRAMGYTLKSEHGNTFIMNVTTAAVLIEEDNQFYDVQGTWPALGGSSYYLVNTDLLRETDVPFKLDPGVILKFAADKSFIWEYNFNDIFAFRAMGTSENPIIFDSESENEKWGGMKLSGHFEMAHCQIKNAGSILLPDAPVAGNVFIALNAQSSSYPFLKFQDNVVNGSEGYGAIINDYVTPPSDPSNPDNNNVFSNNNLGDYYFINK